MEEASILVSILVLVNEQKADTQSRPSEFVKIPTYLEDSDDEESIVGKMPPAEESDSGE